jgi:hypothetical protein
MKYPPAGIIAELLQQVLSLLRQVWQVWTYRMNP